MRPLWWLGAMVVAFAAACSGGGTDTDAAGRADGFRAELEARGQVVVPLGTFDRGMLDAHVDWWSVSDIVVGVHAYPDDDEMARGVARLEDPTFLAVTDFAVTPHFYARDRLIVEAAGEHDALAPTLVELLGPELPVDAFGFEPTLGCEQFSL